MSSYAQHALTKLNEDRMGKQIFSDFIIKTGTREFPVHKCLLGVTSEFFRGMFESEMKERYETYWDAKGFEPGIIDAILNFLYDVPSSITSVNVNLVVEAADFMQIPTLLEYCAKFISTNLTDQNLFQNWQLAKQYRLKNLADICRKYAANNFHALSRRSEILSLDVTFFEEFLDARSNATMEERAYEAIISWINFDRGNRSTYFGQTFVKINLDKISKSFINSEISNNELVFDNPEASKKLFLAMKEYMMSEKSDQKLVSTSSSTLPESSKPPTILRETELPIQSKPASVQKFSSPLQPPARIAQQTNSATAASVVETKFVQPHQPNLQSKEFVLLGGMTSPSYARKYNTETKLWSRLADLCDVCIEAQLARFKSFLYVLGGRLANDLNSYTDVWRLNTNSSNSEWSSCTAMSQKRHRFGCVEFRNRIYVAGGRAHKTELLSAVESYDPYRDCWKDEPDMNYRRAGCGFVEYRGFLHAIGGQIQQANVTNTMELLAGKKWILSSKTMNYSRSDFSAAVCNNSIYVAGGTFGEQYLSSVEMYNNKTWTSIARVKTFRAGHGVCVIGDKMYIAGGKNEDGAVKTMEVFSPNSNCWEVIGEIKGDPIGVAMVLM